MKEIFSRRSIRKYKGEPVEQEKIDKMLRAAMYAPSAGNEQPWHFIVIKDRDVLTDITKFHPHTHMLKEAPMAVIVCADTSDIKYDGAFWIQDIAASVQTLMLEAESLGIGTCWCGVYPKKELVDNMVKLLDLPEHIIPAAIVAAGYAAEQRKVRDRYSASRVHNEKW